MMALEVDALRSPAFAVVNGRGGTLEERLAAAQAERGTPNLLRQLEFIGVAEGEHVELQVLGVHRRPGDSFPVTRAVHASRANAARLLGDAERWTAQGAYIITGQLKPAVETRHARPGCWFDVPKRGGTTDSDIASRRILPIDFDVARVAQTSATDAEMALAVPPALRCWEFLADMVGEGALAYLHSGNGRQIHVALDAIESTEEVTKLVASILHGLDALFSTEAVKIDVALSDPKRLVPACGTTKKKGAAGILERPHRRTAIVTPDEVRRVDLVHLRALHTRIRLDCDESGRLAMDEAMGIKAPKKTPTSPTRAPAGDDPFAAANALDPGQVAEWLDLYDAGTLRCPGCGESQGVDIIDHGLKCLHDRCTGKGRNGFRTNLDLVMEVRGVSVREAYGLLAERFGLEALPDRKPPTPQANGQTHYTRDEAPSEEPPPGRFDGEPPHADEELQREAVREAQRSPAASPVDIVRRWRVEGPLVHAPTGFPTLDEACGGGLLIPRRVVIIGAPGAAKTGLGMVIVSRYATQSGYVVGLHAVDEDDDDLNVRLAQRMGFSIAECEQREPATLVRLEAALATLPIRFYGADWTIEAATADLGAWSKQAQARPVYFSDSVQTIRAEAALKAESPREQVEANMRAIRVATTGHRLLSILTCEANRNAYRNEDAAESSDDMAAGAESRAIEFSAQTLLMLRTPKGHPDTVRVTVPKNRRGRARFEFFLHLDRIRHELTECANPLADPNEIQSREDEKRAGNRAKVARDAMSLAAVVRLTPRMGETELRAALRAAGHPWGVERLEAARKMLMGGLEGERLARLDIPRHSRKPPPRPWRATSRSRAASSWCASASTHSPSTRSWRSPPSRWPRWGSNCARCRRSSPRGGCAPCRSVAGASPSAACSWRSSTSSRPSSRRPSRASRPMSWRSPPARRHVAQVRETAWLGRGGLPK